MKLMSIEVRGKQPALRKAMQAKVESYFIELFLSSSDMQLDKYVQRRITRSHS